MLVGVPKEIKAQEYRVGLTPSAVREYVASGHRVIVERGAGDGIGASDQIYQRAGATIAESAEDVFQRAEYLKDHGMVDMVVHRHQLRPTLARLCRVLTKAPPAPPIPALPAPAPA